MLVDVETKIVPKGVYLGYAIMNTPFVFSMINNGILLSSGDMVGFTNGMRASLQIFAL